MHYYVDAPKLQNGCFRLGIDVDRKRRISDIAARVINGELVPMTEEDKDLKYSKEILRNPQGILKKYSPLTGAIITLVWNCVVAIWGILGVVGVVGSIYYLVGVRGFVMENKDEFEKYEANS